MRQKHSRILTFLFLIIFWASCKQNRDESREDEEKETEESDAIAPDDNEKSANASAGAKAAKLRTKTGYQVTCLPAIKRFLMDAITAVH